MDLRLCFRWTLLLLTAMAATQDPAAWSPVNASDRIFSHRLHNRQQCSRLCWYVSTCARYSYLARQGETPPCGGDAGGDNCVLHAAAGPGPDLPPGWGEAPASDHGLTPAHGCAARRCAGTEVCVPVASRHATSVCASLPGYNDCASMPCANGGNCVDHVNNYTCTCVAGYTGRDCQTENWLELSCTDHSDCVGNTTACYSGQCLCDGGYFFSHSQCACVPDCETFHPTHYVKYTDWDFNGHNWFSNKTTLDQCQASCSADQQCLMFVRVNARCYLKIYTPRDFPDSWIQREGVQTHQKTCV